jgi:cephalosporin hydroxylase
MEWKYYREFWIGSTQGKVWEFHNSRMNDIEAFNEGRSHYSVRYHRENYADEEFFGLEKYHNKTLAKLNMEDGLYLTDKGVIHDYLSDYDKLFMPLREKSINIFEVGFQYGGSCKLWEKYFPYARIMAIDISTERPYEKDAIRLGIKTKFTFGDRVTMELRNMNSVTQEYFEGFTPDIAIDDGSHTMEDQLYFIKTVYPVLNKGGILIVEDVQDIINQKVEFEKLGIPFEIVDRRYVCYDNVLLIYRK